MEEVAEALRRRIELYLHHLHEGVEGPRLFIYLRQIAEDEEALSKLTDADSTGQATHPPRVEE
jgi:hypothetical protein